MIMPPLGAVFQRCESVLAGDVARAKARPSERGFAIGLIILAVVLFAAMGAAIALSSKDSGMKSQEQTARLYASSILDQGSKIGTAYQLMEGSGVDASRILMAPTGRFSILDPTSGAISAQVPPSQALDTSSGLQLTKFRYVVRRTACSPGPTCNTDPLNNSFNADTKITTVGLATPDPAFPYRDKAYVVFLPGIKFDVCYMINNSLYGDALRAEPIYAGGVLQQHFIADTDTATDEAYYTNTTDGLVVTPTDTLATAAGTTLQQASGRQEGCLQTTDGFYVYFKVLEAN